jgi:tetratricopeptide (TPR) repeat protein
LLLGALRVLQMEAYGWRAEWEEAERCTEEAVRLLPQGSMPSCRALGVMIGMAGAMGRYERLPEQIDTLVALEPAEDAAGSYLWAALLSTLITIAARRPELAGPLLVRVGEVGARAASREPALGAWSELARTHAPPMSRGRGVSPLRYALAAAELFERTGDLRMAALARVNVGLLYVELGAHAEAERTLRLAVEGGERVAAFHTTARAKSNLAIALVAAGAGPEAERIARGAAEMFATHKNARYEGSARRTLARALLLAGRLDEAEQEAVRSAEVLAPIRGERANALATLACIHLARKKVGEAMEAARLAHDELAQTDRTECDEAFVGLTYARALHARGARHEAKTAILEALGRVEAHAAKSDDDVLRASFLRGVEENASIASLAAAWGRAS